jgi:hypothetical protein
LYIIACKDQRENVQIMDSNTFCIHDCFVFPGSIKVYVGGQQPNQKKTVNSNVLSAVVKINGYKHIKWYTG